MAERSVALHLQSDSFFLIFLLLPLPIIHTQKTSFMNRFFTLKASFLLVALTLVFSSCSSTKLPTADNLLTAITTNPKLTQFASLLEMAGGLGSVLGDDGKFTLFAPSNEALSAMGDDAISTITDPDNKTLLTNVLRGHAVSGALSPKKVGKEELLTNAMGKNLGVSGTESNLMVGGANIVESIKTKNGFVHVIDKVLKN